MKYKVLSQKETQILLNHYVPIKRNINGNTKNDLGFKHNKVNFYRENLINSGFNKNAILNNGSTFYGSNIFDDKKIPVLRVDAYEDIFPKGVMDYSSSGILKWKDKERYDNNIKELKIKAINKKLREQGLNTVDAIYRFINGLEDFYYTKGFKNLGADNE